MEEEQEKYLIEKAKKDPEAMGKIFDRYYESILNYVLKRTGQIQIAQDITSQVFFLVVKKLWQFKWKGIPFSAWLYRIANNEIALFFRKNKYKPVSLDLILEQENWEPADDQDLERETKEIEEILEEHKDFLVIQKELLNIPIKYQEVITLRYLDEKKMGEIAEILGKKENTVKSLLKRGISLLQQKVHLNKLAQPFSSSLISEGEPS